MCILCEAKANVPKVLVRSNIGCDCTFTLPTWGLSVFWGSYLQSAPSVESWQPWWHMFSPPWSMPFYRETTEQLLLLGSFEFQEIRRTLYWSAAQFFTSVAATQLLANDQRRWMNLNRFWSQQAAVFDHRTCKIQQSTAMGRCQCVRFWRHSAWVTQVHPRLW